MKHRILLVFAATAALGFLGLVLALLWVGFVVVHPVDDVPAHEVSNVEPEPIGPSTLPLREAESSEPRNTQRAEEIENPVTLGPETTPGPISFDEIERRAAVAEMILEDSSRGGEYSVPCLLACESAIKAVETFIAIDEAAPEVLDDLLSDPGTQHLNPEGACGVSAKALERRLGPK